MLFSVESQAWQFKFAELQHEYVVMADQFMEEHKIKYRDENTSKDGCIHQLAKSIGTILRRDICPKVTLRMKEAKVDKQGNKIRRRNVYGGFDAKYNVIEIDDSDVEQMTDDDGNKPTVVITEVTKSDAKINSVDAYKGKVKEYILKWKADGNGNYLAIDHIDDVSNVFIYGISNIIELN